MKQIRGYCVTDFLKDALSSLNKIEEKVIKDDLIEHKKGREHLGYGKGTNLFKIELEDIFFLLDGVGDRDTIEIEVK